MRYSFLTLILLGLFGQNAMAENSPWMVRLRAIDVHPDVSSKVTGLTANAKVDNQIVPEFDISYFFTKNIAAELILATSKHDVKTNTGIDLGHAWALPPTLTLQYHFNPEGTFKPYVGAGLGYIMYYNVDHGAVGAVKYDNGMAYALQAGLDYKLDEHWGLNFDVKKLYHNTEVTINGGAITADVDLDPWVFGTGVSYRF